MSKWRWTRAPVAQDALGAWTPCMYFIAHYRQAVDRPRAQPVGLLIRGARPDLAGFDANRVKFRRPANASRAFTDNRAGVLCSPMNVFFDGVEALRARYAYLSGGGCTAICGGRRGAFRDVARVYLSACA